MSDVYVGDDGKLHKTKGGADTVLNFSSIKSGELIMINAPVSIDLGFRPSIVLLSAKNNLKCGFVYNKLIDSNKFVLYWRSSNSEFSSEAELDKYISYRTININDNGFSVNKTLGTNETYTWTAIR